MRLAAMLSMLLAVVSLGSGCSSDPVPQPPAIVAPALPVTPGGGGALVPPGTGTPPVTIAPPTGAPPPGGESQVLTGGQAVWPPTGPGCDRYVACCQAAGAMASDLGLACQLAVATPPVDCAAALASIRGMISQRGQAPPPACAP
jgi:hypothetical protein